MQKWPIQFIVLYGVKTDRLEWHPRHIHYAKRLIMLNIPNLLTLFRLVLIPFILIAYYWPSESRFLWASGLFMLAAATDWLDGFLARKLNQTTDFGAFLDPVADKVTVAVALVVLVESYSCLLYTSPSPRD